MNNLLNTLKLVRLGIDTQQEFIVFIPANCFIYKSEGFEASTQIIVSLNNRSIVATINMVHSNILKNCEASLSESAWERIDATEGDYIRLTHLPPLSSLGYVRSKIYGNKLTEEEFGAIIQDIVAGKYSNIHLASFITACGHDNLSINEVVSLTKAMVDVGEQLHWDDPVIVDKHSVGGIPGNRTTPIVVAIVAAAGLIIPKTSSRAITSPAGTSDTIETMTKVTLSASEIQAVVAREGGCMAWGGALGLSPADDILIRVERVLDLDPVGQMIASVLSKKVAIAATHVIIDIPVGPTAKIRSNHDFMKLKHYFTEVGEARGLHIYALKSDGKQPLGKGIGPSLEAKDILKVLRNDMDAPLDLKDKALLLSSILMEFSGKVPAGNGLELAKNLLESGAALKKFMAICEAQGGFKEPQIAPLSHDICAESTGIITEIDNRNLAKIAKLAGAPHDQTAGIEFFSKIGTQVERGQVLFRIHSESQGALEYSCAYAMTIPDIVKVTKS